MSGEVKVANNTRGPRWDVNFIPDQSGKVALVTGANAAGSIGWNVAHELSKKGAKVFIHARSEEKAQGAIKSILKASPSIPKSNLGTFVAEFTDLKAIKAAAEKFSAEQDRLDLLVNNAALLPRPLDKDANGISLSILVNHLAPFTLTTSLLPLLKKTALTGADARIVASATHTFLPGSLRFRNLDDFNVSFGGEDGMQCNYLRYGLSKLLNVLFAKELQRKFDAEGTPIISVSLHPGLVATPGATRVMDLYDNKAVLDGALTPVEGAMTALFAGTAPEVRTEKAKYSGAYLMPFGVVSPGDESGDAKNAELATEAFVTSEQLIADFLAK